MGKHGDAPLQNAMDMRNSNSVIGHGHSLICRAFHPVTNFSFIQHTAAAVQNQSIGRQIFRKFRTGAKGKRKVFFRIFPKPSGQLYRADVLALPVSW